MHSGSGGADLASSAVRHCHQNDQNKSVTASWQDSSFASCHDPSLRRT